MDGIFHLVRAFDSDEVIHVDDSVDPIRDLETIQGELCAKDKNTLEGVLEREKDRVRKEKGLSRQATNFTLSDAFTSAYEKVRHSNSKKVQNLISKCQLFVKNMPKQLFPPKALKLVESNTPIQTGEFKDSEVDIIRDWGCITTKPQIYVVNLSQKNFIRKGNKWLQKIVDWVKEHGGGQILPVSCEFEQTLFDLKDDPESQKGMKYTFF